MSWKQVSYYGYDQLTTTGITELVNAGATQIILEFIVLKYSGGYYYLSLFDTVSELKLMTTNEKKEIYTAMSQKNLLLSFGGASSECILNAIGQPYKTYASNFVTETILTAEIFVADIETIINQCSAGTSTAYNIDGIDLDIEGITGTEDTTTSYTFLGEISKGITEIVMPDGRTPFVTHAPQTPYFNNKGFGFIYVLLEYYYSNYISFYNVQFYNQGATYKNYISNFYDDTVQISSLLQIANASVTINNYYGEGTISENVVIDTSKLVMGKVTYGESEDGTVDGYVTLWNDNNNYYNPSMTYFVNLSYNYVSPDETDLNYPTTEQMEPYLTQLNNWVINGGIMCWIYNPANNNSDLLGYFEYNTGGTCFMKGTNILCLKNNLQVEIKVEDLNEGDLVLTSKNEYKKIIYIGYNFLRLQNEIKNNVKYIKKNTFSNNIPNKDLYLTTGHSLLFKDLTHANKFYDKKYYPENEKIDDYIKIMIQHLTITNDNDNFNNIMYYHFVLESDNINEQYGIYANNVLCETMSYSYISKSKLYRKNE